MKEKTNRMSRDKEKTGQNYLDSDFVMFIHYASGSLRKIIDDDRITKNGARGDMFNDYQVVLSKFQALLTNESTKKDFLESVRSFIDTLVMNNIQLANQNEKGDQRSNQSTIKKIEDKNTEYLKLKIENKELSEKYTEIMSSYRMLKDQLHKEHLQISEFSSQLRQVSSSVSSRVLGSSSFIEDELRKIQQYFDHVQFSIQDYESAKALINSFIYHNKNVLPKDSLSVSLKNSLDRIVNHCQENENLRNTICEILSINPNENVNVFSSIKSKLNEQMVKNSQLLTMRDRMAETLLEIQQKSEEIKKSLEISENSKNGLESKLGESMKIINDLKAEKESDSNVIKQLRSKILEIQSSFEKEILEYQKQLDEENNKLVIEKNKRRKYKEKYQMICESSKQIEDRLNYYIQGNTEMYNELQNSMKQNDELNEKLDKANTTCYKYDELLKDYESAKTSISDLGFKLNSMKKEVLLKENIIENLKQSIQSITDLNSEMKMKIEERDSKIKSISANNEEISLELSSLQSQVNDLKASKSRIQQVYDQVISENEQLHKDFGNVTSEMRESTNALNKLNQENIIAKQRIQGLMSENRANEQMINDLSEKDNKNQNLIANLTSQLNNALVEKGKFESNLKDITNQYKIILKENKYFKSIIEQMKIELDNEKAENKNMREIIESQTKELQEVNENYQLIESKVIQLNQDLLKKNQEISSIDNEKGDLSRKFSLLRKKFKDCKKELNISEIELNDLKQENEKLLQTRIEYENFQTMHFQELQKYENTISEINEAFSLMRQKRNNIKKMLNQTLNEFNTYKQNTDKEQKEFYGTIKQLEQTIDKVKSESCNKTELTKSFILLQEKESSIQKLSTDLSTTKSELSTVQQKMEVIQKARNQYDELQREKNNISQQYNTLVTMVTTLHKTITQSIERKSLTLSYIIGLLKPIFSSIQLNSSINTNTTRQLYTSVIWSLSSNENGLDIFNKSHESVLNLVFENLKSFPIETLETWNSSMPLLNKLKTINTIINIIHDSYKSLSQSHQNLTSVVKSQHEAIMKMSQKNLK